MNLVELNNANVVLGTARVLDGLTFAIGEGEHTAILGPNGAGKSTFIKLLTMQLRPIAPAPSDPSMSGRVEGAPIRVFGQDRWDVFALRAQLGIVSADLHDRFVQGNVAGRISARDAVLSGFFASQGLFANHDITADMRSAADAALARMGVAHLAGTPLDRVSTGEARRVLIARALVHQPKALVLDEPTRGLDLVARHQFMEAVRRLAQSGTTILIVTHHIEEIIPEIDRVILLKGGRVIADGAKSTTLTSPILSEAFDAPLAVHHENGYYHVRVDGQCS